MITDSIALVDPSAIRRFVLAGNAVFTIRSKRTGDRFTYKLASGETKRNRTPYWLKVLTGSNNEADYSFAGTIWVEHVSEDTIRIDGGIRPGAKSTISQDAPSVAAFKWFFAQMFVKWDAENVLENAEFYHEGRCARCARRLTVPESIESGFGPECIQHAGVFGNYKD